jgi:hypothetical protein
MKEVDYTGPSTDEEEKRKHAERSRGSEDAPALRTFRGDVEEMVEAKGVTKAQAVVAEEERRTARGEARVVREESTGLGRIIFLLLLVIGFGIGVGGYALFGTKPVVEVATSTPVLPEALPTLHISSVPREQTLADILIYFGKVNPEKDALAAITVTIDDAAGVSHTATTKELLTSLALRAPRTALLRALSDKVEYGVYGGGRTVGYIQVSVRSYPNSFAEMLAWEATLARDLVPALSPQIARRTIDQAAGRAFTDSRIEGTDMRVLMDDNDNTLLAYTFRDQKVLLIAGSTDALVALLHKVQ